jgi:riboflavin kinase/FMN adenylyltransferase
MKIVEWDDLVEGRDGFPGPVSLTIGVFDGVHLGHRRLLREITGQAAPDRAGTPAPAGCTPIVVTFRDRFPLSKSPGSLLFPARFPGQLQTFRQKIRCLESLGVGGVVAIDFSEQLSRLSGKTFIRVLRENLAIEKIAVGYDFRFGKDRDTDSKALQGLVGVGVDVSVVEPVRCGGEAVSSSRIRAAILEGGLDAAAEMLAAPYSLDVRDVMAEKSLLERRTMRMRRSEIRQCLPKPGCYPVSCEAETAAYDGLLIVREDEMELELSGGGEIREVVFTTGPTQSERSPNQCL